MERALVRTPHGIFEEPRFSTMFEVHNNIGEAFINSLVQKIAQNNLVKTRLTRIGEVFYTEILELIRADKIKSLERIQDLSERRVLEQNIGRAPVSSFAVLNFEVLDYLPERQESINSIQLSRNGSLIEMIKRLEDCWESIKESLYKDNFLIIIGYVQSTLEHMFGKFDPALTEDQKKTNRYAFIKSFLLTCLQPSTVAYPITSDSSTGLPKKACEKGILENIVLNLLNVSANLPNLGSVLLESYIQQEIFDDLNFLKTKTAPSHVDELKRFICERESSALIDYCTDLEKIRSRASVQEKIQEIINQIFEYWIEDKIQSHSTFSSLSPSERETRKKELRFFPCVLKDYNTNIRGDRFISLRQAFYNMIACCSESDLISFEEILSDPRIISNHRVKDITSTNFGTLLDHPIKFINIEFIQGLTERYIIDDHSYNNIIQALLDRNVDLNQKIKFKYKNKEGEWDIFTVQSPNIPENITLKINKISQEQGNFEQERVNRERVEAERIQRESERLERVRRFEQAQRQEQAEQARRARETVQREQAERERRAQEAAQRQQAERERTRLLYTSNYVINSRGTELVLNHYRLYEDLSHLSNEELTQHYHAHGMYENRLPKLPREFDVRQYYTLYRDVYEGALNQRKYKFEEFAMWHYLNYGIKENRLCGYQDFMVDQSLEARAERLRFSNNILDVQIRFDRLIVCNSSTLKKDSCYFDYVVYRLHEDLKHMNYVQLFDHYQKHCKNEGRLGSLPLYFNWEVYLQINEDLMPIFNDVGKTRAQKEEWAKWHFINYGHKEGRYYALPSDFNLARYLTKHPELREIGSNQLGKAFRDYAQVGFSE